MPKLRGVMSLWWLRYDRGGRLLGVLIIEAASMVSARLRAAVDGIDADADFAEGHELDERTARAIPARQIGRMLAPKEALALLDKIERAQRTTADRSKAP